MHSSLWLQVVDTCIQYEGCTYASDWISVLVVDASAQQPKRGEAYSSTSSMRAKDNYGYASANTTSTGAATGIGPTMRPQTAIARSVAKPEPISPFDVQSVSSDPTRKGAKLVAAAPEISAWCAARYKSYRPEDNIYQPYVGSRRTCLGPAARDEMASAF
jgi:hypothetical protein